MAPKKVSYSLPNLKTLVNSQNSCVYCIENCSRSMTVLPVHLNNIKRSVNQLLSDKVTTYDAMLSGIILGHKNIKVINHVQLNDDGNFSLDYVADVYVFKPEVGNHLSGEVNKKSKDHIGVLVHSFFNVSIPRPRNDTECPKNWIGFDVNIGQTVVFEVVKVNFSGRLPFIKGKLIDLCEVDFEDRDSGIGGHESMEENIIMKDKYKKDEHKKKKNKKKKRKSEDMSHYVYNDDLQEQEKVNKDEEVTTSEELMNALLKEADDEMNNLSPEKKKKKKKRKSEDMTHYAYNDDLQEQEKVNKDEEVTTSEELMDALLKEADDEMNNLSPGKKKKKKKRKSEDMTHYAYNDDLQEQEKFNKDEEVTTSEELMDALLKEADDEMNNLSPEKKKKKKRKSEDMIHYVYNDDLQEQGAVAKTDEVAISEEFMDALLKEADDEINNCSHEKKKKNKKKVKDDLKAPSVSCTTAETPKSKKRKFSESFSLQETDPNSFNSEEFEEIPVPKKKKKKKHSDSSF